MAANDTQRLQWSAALRSNLEPLTSLHAIVGERIARQKDLEEAIERAIQRVEQEKSQEGDALGALATASDDAVRRARLIGVKLEAALLEGTIKEEAHRAIVHAAFPKGPQSIGTTPAQRLEALERASAAIEQHLPGEVGDPLAELARGGASAIRAANDAAKREQSDTRVATEELARVRHEFDEGYLATREIVSGLLRDAGRINELRDIVPG